MNNNKYHNMSQEELATVYLRNLIHLDISLSECITTVVDLDGRIGRDAAKIIMECNKLACMVIAKLYMNELAIGQEADLFDPYVIDLKLSYKVE